MNPQQPTSKGGPAFPGNGHPGMTLRDHFAGIAFGIIVKETGETMGIDDKWNTERVAEDAYALADAMLVERVKKRDDEPPRDPMDLAA